MKKAKSSYDLAPKPDLKFKNPMKYQSSADLFLPQSTSNCNNSENKKDDSGKHKVVIYFSDAYNNICHSKINGAQSNNDIDHANRLANEMQSKAQSSENLTVGNHSTKDFMTQLKTVLEEKSKFTHKFDNLCPEPRPTLKNKFLAKPAIPEKPNVLQINQLANSHGQINEKSFGNGKLLPSYIESIDENNVIKLKIEQNFKKASELVNLISSLPKGKKKIRKHGTSIETSSIHELNFSHEDIDENDTSTGLDEFADEEDTVSEPDEGYFYDWSFVQEWRSR